MWAHEYSWANAIWLAVRPIIPIPSYTVKPFQKNTMNFWSHHPALQSSVPLMSRHGLGLLRGEAHAKPETNPVHNVDSSDTPEHPAYPFLRRDRLRWIFPSRKYPSQSVDSTNSVSCPFQSSLEHRLFTEVVTHLFIICKSDERVCRWGGKTRWVAPSLPVSVFAGGHIVHSRKNRMHDRKTHLKAEC